MSLSAIVFSILGLCLFEVVSSLDNAVVNADVLSTMQKKWRKWFLVWGIFFSVFLIRGLLPWVIVWMANPSLGPIEALVSTFSNDPKVVTSIMNSSPRLLMAGGVFLVFLFLHWLFLEEKNFGLPLERFIHRHGMWFYAIVSVFLTTTVWVSVKKDPYLAFAAAVGSSLFFVTHGFKEHAARMELQLKDQRDLSDISKLLYLEVLDATFSIDGVVGAFAFTMSVPLILLGNGIGAIVVRDLTIRGVDRLKNYPFLKNGAMYSVFCLGVVMVLEGFGVHVPHYIPPMTTFVVIGIFGVISIKIKK